MQPAPGAAESERILAGEGCAVFERSEFAPAAKIRVDEGSLRSKPATGVAFFCLLFRRRCASRERGKKSKWPRGHEAQSKMIRKCIQATAFFKIIRFVLLCEPMDCRIKFGNDGATFQVA